MARRFATTAAFHELLDLIRNGDAAFLEGPRAVDDASALEGYRYLTEVLSVALDCFLWADAGRPTIVPIVSPTPSSGATTPTPSIASRRSGPIAPIGCAGGAATCPVDHGVRRTDDGRW
jgi:hypothetical protein